MVRLVGWSLVAALLLAGVAFPVVGGLGELSAQTVGGVESAAPGVLSGQMPGITTITDDSP